MRREALTRICVRAAWDALFHVYHAVQDVEVPVQEHVEITHAGKGVLRDAQEATNVEHQLGLLKSARLYPKAIAWSILLSTALIMEGYDLLLMGSLYAQPSFAKKYGSKIAPLRFPLDGNPVCRMARRWDRSSD
jgi:hypothetical protein